MLELLPSTRRVVADSRRSGPETVRSGQQHAGLLLGEASGCPVGAPIDSAATQTRRLQIRNRDRIRPGSGLWSMVHHRAPRSSSTPRASPEFGTLREPVSSSAVLS